MASVRNEIERNVHAYHNGQNSDLWNQKISNMEIVELLRHAHPDERSRLADKAIEAGLLTKEEGREFIRFVR